MAMLSKRQQAADNPAKAGRYSDEYLVMHNGNVKPPVF
jgi:hypothetical protein